MLRQRETVVRTLGEGNTECCVLSLKLLCTSKIIPKQKGYLKRTKNKRQPEKQVNGFISVSDHQVEWHLPQRYGCVTATGFAKLSLNFLSTINYNREHLLNE